MGTQAPAMEPDCVDLSFLYFLDIPWEVLRSVSTLAQSVISFAVVAILATSAPAAHIASRVVSRALSVGVLSKLCEDRMILVSIGTAPPPGTEQYDMTIRVQCRSKSLQGGHISSFPNKIKWWWDENRKDMVCQAMQCMCSLLPRCKCMQCRQNPCSQGLQSVGLKPHQIRCRAILIAADMQIHWSLLPAKK